MNQQIILRSKNEINHVDPTTSPQQPTLIKGKVTLAIGDVVANRRIGLKDFCRVEIGYYDQQNRRLVDSVGGTWDSDTFEAKTGVDFKSLTASVHAMVAEKTNFVDTMEAYIEAIGRARFAQDYNLDPVTDIERVQ